MAKSTDKNLTFGHNANSVQCLIESGNKEFLEKIGMTKAQAKRALNAYLKEITIDARAMEKWYYQEVRGR